MWNLLVKPIADLFGKGLDIVDDLVEDKDLANKIRAEVQTKIMSIAHTELVSLLESQTKIILGEIQGESWLQRNWRPLIMAEFGTIILNNYILAPYLGLFMGNEYQIMLLIPPDMWALLKIGLGGYVVGRSMEKIANGEGLRSVAGKIMNGSGGRIY